MIKYFSTFSGIAGIELGIQQAYESLCNQKIRRQRKTKDISIKFSRSISSKSDVRQPPTCVGYSEIDKYAIQIYEKHYPEHKNYGDITKIIATEVPDHDLFVGGFPCQSFSIAGKRGRFKDTRGTLFFDVARIIKVKRPKNVLLENVKGLLSHDQGNTFATIISTLDELGYDLQWQVLNSKNFGVPQNRERVFIIGHLRGTPRPKVFPIGETDQVFDEEYHSEERPSEIRFGRFCGKATTPKGVASTITKNYGALSGDGTKILQVNKPKHSNNRVYSGKGISPTLNTAQGGNRQPFIANTIDANYYKENSPSHRKQKRLRTEIIQDSKIRRLTPTECERLQGFPDGWTEGLSDTQRYKTLGNAVTVNVIKAVISKLI